MGAEEQGEGAFNGGLKKRGTRYIAIVREKVDIAWANNGRDVRMFGGTLTNNVILFGRKRWEG